MTDNTDTQRRSTVLVVDDAPDHREIIAEYLCPLYEVRTAGSGSEAIALARTAPVPDLVLLDVVMPGMDGYAVLAALREAPETRDVPVIFVTASDAGEDEERGLTLGAVDFVVKPIHPATLMARVATHLALGAATRALKLQNALLEQRVAERTQKLARAFFAADAANRAKSEFLANMSHAIRTPLNGIIGMSDLLLDTPLTSQQREYAGVAKSSAESLQVVLTDVLDFAEAGADGIVVKPGPFDLRDLVGGLHDLFFARAVEKGLAFGCSVAPPTPTRLTGDAAHLRQVLLKLLDNAFEFTDRGSVSLAVSPAASGQPEAPALRFEVRDSGVGIAASEHDAIFHPFAQVDGSLARRHGGLGLGLATTRHLVELLKGSIGVESRVGSGSLFWFELPFSPAEAE